jgi:hypothetical protein
MKEEMKNIDRIAKEAAENYSAKAPYDAWSRLENELDSQNAILKMVFVRRAIAVAAVLLAFIAGYQIAVINMEKPQIPELSQLNPNGFPLLKKQKAAGIAQNQSTVFQASNSKFNTQFTNTNSIDQNLYLSPQSKISASFIQLPGKQITTSTSDFFYNAAVFEPSDTSPAPVIILPPRSEKLNKNTWSLLGSAGPLLASNSNSLYENHNSYDATQTMEASTAETDGQVFAFNSGIGVNFSIMPRLSLGTGIYYSRTGQNLNADAFSTDPAFKGTIPIETKFGQVKMNQYAFASSNLDMPQESFAIVERKLDQLIEYIEIPFNVQYIFIDKRLKTSIFSGVTQNILVGNNVVYREGQESIVVGKTEDLRESYISSQLGLRMQYRLTDRFWIHLDPSARYPLQSLSKDSDINVYPLSFSLNTGIIYSFD